MVSLIILPNSKATEPQGRNPPRPAAQSQDDSEAPPSNGGVYDFLVTTREFTEEGEKIVAVVSNLLNALSLDNPDLYSLVGNVLSAIPFNMSPSLVSHIHDDVIRIMTGSLPPAVAHPHQYVKL